MCTPAAPLQATSAPTPARVCGQTLPVQTEAAAGQRPTPAGLISASARPFFHSMIMAGGTWGRRRPRQTAGGHRWRRDGGRRAGCGGRRRGVGAACSRQRELSAFGGLLKNSSRGRGTLRLQKASTWPHRSPSCMPWRFSPCRSRLQTLSGRRTTGVASRSFTTR